MPEALGIHYAEAGHGPTVVLLHGWPFTWREWRPLMPLLADAGFHVLAPDLKGIGDSARPATGYRKQEVAEDLHQFIRTVEMAPIRLVGSDIGAMVAQAWALSHPEEITHLVLAESILPGPELHQAMNFADGGSWHFGFHAQLDLAEMLTAGKEAEYLGAMWDLMSLPGVSPEERTEYLRTYAAPGGMRGGFQHYATLRQDIEAAGRALTERGQLTMPVLVLNGEKGLPQQPLLAGARRLTARIDADIVPASAHTIGSDNPVWTAGRLTRFFSGHAASSNGRRADLAPA